MIGNLAISNTSILAKGVPVLFEAGEKEKQLSWLGKNEHLFVIF